MLGADWDLALCLTDVPLQVSRRPVVGHAGPLHGVGVLSLPALGAVARRRRALEVTLGLVEALVSDGDDDPEDPGDRATLGRRLRQLATDPADAAEGVRFTARVLSGNLRLISGMVRANRPWRLAARLSAGRRLAQLWERQRQRRVRKQVVLFDIATAATVTFGVLSLYLALFVLALLGALLLVVEPLFSQGLGHPAQFSDYLELAWLTSSPATVGGALGAGLESDEAVREAACTYRPGQPAPRGTAREVPAALRRDTEA